MNNLKEKETTFIDQFSPNKLFLNYFCLLCRFSLEIAILHLYFFSYKYIILLLVPTSFLS